jgi:hypothetical protein
MSKDPVLLITSSACDIWSPVCIRFRGPRNRRYIIWTVSSDLFSYYPTPLKTSAGSLQLELSGFRSGASG